MFEILEEDFAHEPAVRLKDTTGHQECLILCRGALLNEFQIGPGRQNLVAGYSESELDKIGESFRSAWLIPFPNRIDGGTYSFKNEHYQLEQNFPHEQNAIHGLIYNQLFEIQELKKEEEHCAVTLSHRFEGAKGFPFPFVTIITYSMSAKGLEVEVKITNTGQVGMPLGVGWHPYFKMNDEVDTLLVTLPTQEQLEMGERGIPTGAKWPYKLFSFKKELGDAGLDDCFTTTGEFPVTELFDSQSHIRLSIWQQSGENGYGFLQVYTPDERDSIAVEPMTCAPNAFNTQQGLISLEPADSKTFRCGLIAEMVE